MGLSCHPFAEWSEAVLRKVRPHLVELSVRAATLKHLRVIRDMSSLRKLDLDIGDTAGEEVPTLPLQLEELTMNEFTGGHLQSIQWMPNLRRLHLMGYSEDELEFTAMPEHCGLQYIDVAISSDPTTLSLVRANRATLSELQVYCATRPGHCFINNLSASLHQCGANGLRRLTLRRNPWHHDLRNCRLQLEAFRARFGPGVGVQCSLCVDE
ncbi:uncharacterized protein LOC117642431 [Thrips palmi]|uniref:Uncharacterized protein LOC117642431 n=1 Tax=Thrips palmi TaxID=161013 RepID=A0A6P8ZK62_THRPL|nr:uncharacterized protein LOC117642431 [Thrips palmi]